MAVVGEYGVEESLMVVVVVEVAVTVTVSIVHQRVRAGTKVVVVHGAWCSR